RHLTGSDLMQNFFGKFRMVSDLLDFGPAQTQPRSQSAIVVAGNAVLIDESPHGRRGFRRRLPHENHRRNDEKQSQNYSSQTARNLLAILGAIITQSSTKGSCTIPN